MKVFVAGTRGVPDIPGGVERHCEQLYPRIVGEGVAVRLARRSSYVSTALASWKGIDLVDLFSPRKKSLEAIIHTLLAIITARRWGADIVHIHAIGPAIMVPLARLLGMKVVVTNHGPDYDRQKWGGPAKAILRLGEYLGCKYASEVVVISTPIADIVSRRCGRSSNLVYNGVPIPELEPGFSYPESLGLEKGKYFLAVARLVPEKGLGDLLEAYSRLDTGFKLVIAGDADHEDAFSRALKQTAAATPGVIMPGYVTGRDLAELYTHAGPYILPSYHEGLPISLLEALSYGLQTIVSDIPANSEVKLDECHYFPVANIDALAEKLQSAISKKWDPVDRNKAREFVQKKYNWDDIAKQTLAVYNKALWPGASENR